jgi:hypothetical protein
MNQNSTFVAPLPALLLAVLAALLTFPPSLAVWNQQAILDEQGFVSRGNNVLRNDAVQEELAASISGDVGGGGDSIIGTILDNIRPAGAASSPIEGALVEALQLVPRTPASSFALTAVHNEVLEAMRNEVLQAEGDSIYLDLDDAIAQAIPGNVIRFTATDARIEVIERSNVAGAFRVARWLDGRTLLLCLLPLAVLGMGYFLAPSPLEYALQFGLALLATGVLGFVLVRFVMRARVVNNAIDIERSRDAANAAFDIFTRSLVTQELVLAAAGLVIAGAAFMLSRRQNAIS